MLLALVDAEQKFMWVDVGANGSCSDAGLFKETQLYKDFEAGKMRLPTTDSLPNDDRPFPYFILGDNAFALKSWMMTPYSHRNKTHEELIYNYRHSRGRRVVECTFGIFAQRYRCFLKTLEVSHKTARRITLACVCLHNLHRTRYPQSNIDQQEDISQLLPVAWRDDNLTQELSSVTGGRYRSFDHTAAGGGATKTQTWGRAVRGTQIGGSLESNTPLVNVIQPFASRRLAWSHPGATAGSGRARILISSGGPAPVAVMTSW